MPKIDDKINFLRCGKLTNKLKLDSSLLSKKIGTLNGNVLSISKFSVSRF